MGTGKEFVVTQMYKFPANNFFYRK